MQISKKNWTAVSFSDVAIPQKNDIDRESEEVNRYIAGEHMATEDLHIRQWGVLDGQYLGPAFRRKFEKGDILYGSRRTYLKKVAVADFDGITANTTFVIKPNRDKIFPGLLPFLMLSDSFTEHSVKHSKGSVNPYINWKDIANFAFKLPSMDEQKRIADLLWSIDETIEKYTDVVKCANKSKEAVLQSFFKNKPKLKKRRLEDISSLITKGTTPTTAGFKFLDKGINFIKAESISEENVFLTDKFGFISGECHESFKRSQLCKDDILFSIAGVIGRCAIVKEHILAANINQALALIRLSKQDVDQEYVLQFLTSRYVTDHFNRISVKTAQVNVNLKQIGDLEVPIPDIAIQRNLVNKIKRMQNTYRNCLLYVKQIEAIKKLIINQLFG